MTGLSPLPRGTHILGDLVGDYLIMARVSAGGQRIDWAVTRKGSRRIIEQGSDPVGRHVSYDDRVVAMEGRLAVLRHRYQLRGRRAS